MQKPPKKTQKSPHPFGTYRPAIGQLSASYKKTEDAKCVLFVLPMNSQARFLRRRRACIFSKACRKAIGEYD